MNIELKVHDWLAFKESERQAVEARRAIEDEIAAFYKINPQKEGTNNFDVEGYKVKIVNRLTRKIDSDKLQEVASEHDLSEHLSALFRWKPEINAAAWKSCDSDITDVLNEAITTTSGRPSFSIESITTKE